MDKSETTIGIITYHAAYNFGSVLQAYALQKTINSFGFSSEIIDYRTPSQTSWYQSDISLKYGIIHLIKTIGFIFCLKSRKLRREKYENFISTYLNLSAKRYTNYTQLNSSELNYSILISGSDQIWNFACGEFAYESRDAIRPYFLDFGHPQKRIAYASSIGTQSLNYICQYAKFLKKFNSLSSRETIGCRYISKAINRDVVQVVDPTWLLSKGQWDKLPGMYNPSPQRPYILLYTLNMWNRNIKEWINAIKKLSQKYNCAIYSISPLTYIKVDGVNCIQDAGPIDILSYIRNAELVITNTFHGTIFSINLEIPFFSIKASVGSRQQQILELCDLENRIINTPLELENIETYRCNFQRSSQAIEKMRTKSIEYIYNAINL